MLGRIAFVCGWISGYLWVRDPSNLDRISRETAALREEITRAREVAETLTDGQRACDWQLWWLRWLLWSSGVVDILLVVWVFWDRQRRPVVTRNSQQSDPESSSSDNEEPSSSTLVAVQAPGWKGQAGGKGPTSKARPLRPSDLKAGK